MAINSVKQKRTEYTRDKSDGSRTRKAVYLVDGATTPEEAEVADAGGGEAIPAFGAAFSGDTAMVVSNISSEIVEGRITLYEVTVTWTYNKAENDPDRFSSGDEFWTFNGRLEGVQLRSAYAQTKVGATPSLARDVGKLVGVKDDGTVEGAPWDIPIGQLVVTRYKSAVDVDNAFVQGVMGELGKVNSGAYYGFSAGEVKFVDFQIPNEGDTIAQLSFTFEVRKNEAQATLPTYTDPAGNPIAFPGDLKGWDYAWTDEVLSDDATDLVPRVRGLYIAQLYTGSAFTALGLSGSL